LLRRDLVHGVFHGEQQRSLPDFGQLSRTAEGTYGGPKSPNDNLDADLELHQASADGALCLFRKQSQDSRAVTRCASNGRCGPRRVLGPQPPVFILVPKVKEPRQAVILSEAKDLARHEIIRVAQNDPMSGALNSVATFRSCRRENSA
jgi:hypothetical protein